MLNTIKDGNVVKIEGILAETDLKYGSFVRNKENQNIIIVYPRRLYEARGMYLLLGITDKLMEKYDNIEIHFVGKGFEELKVEQAEIEKQLKEIEEGKRKVERFYKIRLDLLDTLKRYDTKIVCAHNGQCCGNIPT